MRKILIVEDTTELRGLLERQLRGHGFEIVAVGSGEDALDAVRRERPDLVLLDVRLPGIDGWTVLRTLKESSDTDSIPVVMLTGQKRAEDLIRGYAQGAVYYVPKPFRLDELLRGLDLAQPEQTPQARRSIL